LRVSATSTHPQVENNTLHTDITATIRSFNMVERDTLTIRIAWDADYRRKQQTEHEA
jgi:hypothetical protein